MGVPTGGLSPPPAAHSKNKVTQHPPPLQNKTNPTKTQPAFAGFALLQEGEKKNSMSGRCWLMNWKVPRVQHLAGVTPEDLCKCDKPRVWAFSGQAVKCNFKAFQNQTILLRLTYNISTPYCKRNFFPPQPPLAGR